MGKNQPKQLSKGFFCGEEKWTGEKGRGRKKDGF